MSELKKFAVSYTIDYQHRVVVGISALNAESAIKIATKAFDEGEIWEDTPDMPLLFDDYEEIEGETLEFSAEKVSEFPEPDSSVIKLKQDQFAYQACRSLLEGDFDAARDFAQKACPTAIEKPENYCLTSLEVLDLAKDHDLDLSLFVNEDLFLTNIFLGAKSGDHHLFRRVDGHSKMIKEHEFLSAYPLSQGDVWRVDSKTPAKQADQFMVSVLRVDPKAMTNSLLNGFRAARQYIDRKLMSLAFFSPLRHLI